MQQDATAFSTLLCAIIVRTEPPKVIWAGISSYVTATRSFQCIARFGSDNARSTKNTNLQFFEQFNMCAFLAECVDRLFVEIVFRNV
jgi:hypothetical protein